MTKIFFSLVLIAAVYLLRKALIPVAIGISIAYVLNPLVDLLQEKFSWRRLPCVLLSLVVVLALSGLMVWGFADMIVGKIASGNFQAAANSLIEYYDRYKNIIDDTLGFSVATFDIGKLLADIGSSLIKIAIGTVAAVYMLIDKEYFIRLGNQTLHLLLPQKIHGRLREILFEINHVIGSFIKGVLIDSVIVAFLASLALSVIGIPYGVFIGCFAGIANIIPYFGPILGIIPAAVAALSMPGGGFGIAIAASLALLAIQQIECNYIYPRIIGKTTGLHPLFVLIAVSVGGYFGGLLWMILAVPAAGILKVLISKWAEAE